MKYITMNLNSLRIKRILLDAIILHEMSTLTFHQMKCDKKIIVTKSINVTIKTEMKMTYK